uniref:hypothetical protein n=1 Tax=uncultured Draconibacterium sp. TaxID=1573823 RepID=UPI0032179833
MKSKTLKLGLFCLVFALVGASCQNDDLSSQEDKQLSVVEVNTIGCKENLKSTDTEQYIQLTAEGENQLRLKFINAVLNCCPGEISGNAFIANDILKVVFTEETPALCNCICCFDLECVIDLMENRTYNIEVYAGSDIAKAKFSFNYSSDLNSRIDITKP